MSLFWVPWAHLLDHLLPHDPRPHCSGGPYLTPAEDLPVQMVKLAIVTTEGNRCYTFPSTFQPRPNPALPHLYPMLCTQPSLSY